MKTTKENPIEPMDDQPAKPAYIKEQHNHNCQQFFGNVTGCVFAMPGANVYQTPSEVTSKASTLQNATCNPQLSKEAIKGDVLDYVMQLHPLYVSKEWQDKYKELWEAILELSEVACKIYNKGRQQNTTFNRNLVGNILHLLAEKKVLTTKNATKLAVELENDENASIRAQLGLLPPGDIERAVRELV